MTKDEAMEKFRQFCITQEKNAAIDRASMEDEDYVPISIDPDQEEDWTSLSLGFFAALGFSASDCTKMALEARYTHHYWC